MVILQTQYFRRYDNINCSTCVVGRDRIVGSKHLPLAELSAMTLSTTSNIRWSNGWRTCKKSCIHQNKQKLHVIEERGIWCHASTHLRMCASIIKRIHESRCVYNELEVPYTQTRNNSLNYICITTILQVLGSSNEHSSQRIVDS